MSFEQEQVNGIREFNRFYTVHLGLLRKHHLDGEFSLTEARVLFEAGRTPGITARQIRESLKLDAGYLSRVLAFLTKRGLITQTRSDRDAREKDLRLTSEGKAKFDEIDRKSAQEIEDLLEGIEPSQRAALLESIQQIHAILSVRIERVRAVDDNAMSLIEEYYESINVIVRDTPAAIQKLVDEPGSGLWLAYLDGEPVGCVILRPLPTIPNASECKRLYVRPPARGRHIADRLMDELEGFAKAYGYRYVYLDTYDDLKAAISLYQKRRYQACERYNGNPQATVFMRKCLSLNP